MNKTDLIQQVAQSAELSQTSASKAIDALFSVIANSLRNGEQVQLTGFGTFSVAERAARNGRNPRTGETITIAASRNPKFKAGKGLKDALN
ncbi:MAG: HU family DNA-binding protein [Gammaproteobacteria bacterium]|nr:HU family DNA-binding protein [Gammaproteobacteria bacterium]